MEKGKSDQVTPTESTSSTDSSVPNSTAQLNGSNDINADEAASKPPGTHLAATPPTSPPASGSASVMVAVQDTQSASDEQAPLPTWVPILLSLLAIGLAITNFIYTFRKDRRTRKQSIQDDYWFRKIASPITIEPLVKNLLAISAEIPTASTIDVETAKKLWQEQAEKVEEFRSSTGALALLSKELPQKLIPHIDIISDALAEFYGCYIQDISTGSKIASREATKGALLDSMISILETIQSYQEKVGYTGGLVKLLRKEKKAADLNRLLIGGIQSENTSKNELRSERGF